LPPTEPTDSELTPRNLSLKLPEQHRGWVRSGIALVVVGYFLALLSLLLEQGFTALPRLREPYVIALGLLAAILERRGQLRAASMIIVGTVWAELHVTLCVGGPHANGVGVLVAGVVGIALLLGTRVAMWAALSALFTLPLAVHLGSVFGWGPGFVSGDIAALVMLLIPIEATAILLRLFMAAFQQVLQRSERNAERARELIDDAPDVVIAINDKGAVEDINAAAEAALGMSRTEARGKPFHALPLVEPTQLATDPGQRRLLEAARQSGADVPREYAVRGTTVTLEGLFRAVTRPDGSTGVLVWLRDVSARKRAERRAAELSHQLQHAQKLEALGQLAGGVAHDFNNLLTTVGGYADLVARHSDPRIRQVSEELSLTRERGAALTKQLLAFARKETSEPRGLDLGQALRDMDRLLRRLLDERITLCLEAPGAAPIFADPGQVQQVVVNLVMNAQDAMKTGGTLRISCRVLPDERVELLVSDTGVGMDAATRARIFEPFFTTKPRGQGTGLGLSTVFGIVEASNGTVSVSTAPGEGTSFRLCWPQYFHGSAAPSSRSSLLPNVAEGGQLLVAEDDPQGRRLLEMLLRQAGYRVVVADSGATALTEYVNLTRRGVGVDLLLSDVRMPGMNGPELAMNLRVMDPKLPVLFISGYFEPDLEGATFDPVEDVLAKPYAAAELLARVERKIGRASAPGGKPARSGVSATGTHQS
jgi:two-component system, cell cycle sensor histidine kinase and response regulator CckA